MSTSPGVTYRPETFTTFTAAAGSGCSAWRLLNYRYAMAISKDLLEILVCPVCKATVELKPDQSGLKCVQCHRVYPVRDDIPVMLVDEAKIEE
jgi:uncharacterized protein YbaR (Trm112 family)